MLLPNVIRSAKAPQLYGFHYLKRLWSFELYSILVDGLGPHDLYSLFSHKTIKLQKMPM
jgi:hypothetical protein